MCLPDGGLGVIDFQDAVIGPVTYDAVSLPRTAMCSGTARISCDGLSNIGSNWRGMIWRLVTRKRFKPASICVVAAPPQGAWGICRLHLRDGKPAYLDDLPLVWHYVREVLAHYQNIPTLRDFSGWLDDAVMPVITKQPWYKDLKAPKPLAGDL